MTTSTDQLRIAKHLLLSAPPGQFDLIARDLCEILPSGSVLTPEWIHSVQIEYNSRTGRDALVNPESVSDSTTDADPDPMCQSLHEGMKNHLSQYYSSEGTQSNYSLTRSKDGGEYTLLLYAERIQLQHYHAGSWTARYTLQCHHTGDSVRISGKVRIHAHTFENGNLQLTSTADLPETTTEMGSREEIFRQIRQWDEAIVLQPLRDVYEDMSGDILKKLRRVMPVTRTRFDWNVQGHRGIRELGAEVHSRE